MIQKLQKIFHIMNSNNLIWIIIISIYALLLSTVGGNHCISGFPVSFWRVCYDASNVSLGNFILGLIIDFIFWFVIVFTSFNFLKFTSRTNYLKYFINPIFLVILGFAIYTPCGGFICLFEGHGYPISYYNNGEFFIGLFLIDLVLLGLINFFVLKISKFVNKKSDAFILKKKNKFNLATKKKITKLFINSYLIFILLVYGIYFLVYINTHEYDDFVYASQAFELFILIPYLSFIIPRFIKKIVNIDNKTLYIIHSVLLVIMIAIGFFMFGL